MQDSNAKDTHKMDDKSRYTVPGSNAYTRFDNSGGWETPSLTHHHEFKFYKLQRMQLPPPDTAGSAAITRFTEVT